MSLSVNTMTESKHPSPHDTPATLTRQIIAATEQARRSAETAIHHGTGQALTAYSELSKLAELRLRIAGVLAPPGRPKKAPGRPANSDHGDHTPHPGLYEVAASLRATLLELPLHQRAAAEAALAEAFPALLAEPHDPQPRALRAPQHLKPRPDAPPPWVRQQWGRDAT